MRRATVAAAATFGLALLAGGCDRGPASTGTSDTSAGPGSNERRLTRAQSIELVDWATTFRRCMASEGTRLGALTKTETHLSMSVPASLTSAEVVSTAGKCGEEQGGPPQRSSLVYRKRQILLYLPKQCLLDKNGRLHVRSASRASSAISAAVVSRTG